MREAVTSEERKASRLDPRLQLVALGLGDSTGRDRGVDAILERLFERIAERARRDVETLRSVVDDSLPLVGRRELLRRDRSAAARDREPGGRHRSKLPFRDLHDSDRNSVS
jgi:hypothetical protein